jgi:hypothetical protein
MVTPSHLSADCSATNSHLCVLVLLSTWQVLHAIHAREDAVDKLRACWNKVNAAVGAGGTGGLLLPSDPLGRLFYRWGGWQGLGGTMLLQACVCLGIVNLGWLGCRMHLRRPACPCALYLAPGT